MHTIRFGIRDGAVKRFLQSNPCTIRCEESFFNRMKEAMPIKWEKHTFLPDENPYQPGEQFMHVTMKDGTEYKFDLSWYFKEPY